MKRSILSILLALALILLAACGEAAATPEPVESVSPEHEEIIEPVAAGPVELPDVGFEIASMWYSGGFGDGGRAVLFLGEPENDLLSAALFMCQYYYEPMGNGYYYTCMYTDSPTLSAARDGDGWRFELDGFSVYFEPDGELIYLEYSNQAGNPKLLTGEQPARLYSPGDYTVELEYPLSFAYVPDQFTRQVWCAMPMFKQEIDAKIPVSGLISDLKAEFGEDSVVLDEQSDMFTIDLDDTQLYGYYSADGEKYYELSIITSDPRYAPAVRGVTIGTPLEDVLSRFMFEPRVFSNTNSLLLYGEYDSHADFGILRADENHVMYCFSSHCVQFNLDENSVVESVRYFISA